MHIFVICSSHITFLHLHSWKPEQSTLFPHYSLNRQHFKSFWFQSCDYRPQNSQSTRFINLSARKGLNDNDYEQITSYFLAQIKWSLTGQLARCDQTPNQATTCNEDTSLMVMTDDDTANFKGDIAAWVAVLLPVWKQRRCTLECVL